MNPTGEKWMDGVTLSPDELMFVKVKDSLVHSTSSLALDAVKYSDWMDGLVRSLTFWFNNTFLIGQNLSSRALLCSSHFKLA